MFRIGFALAFAVANSAAIAQPPSQRSEWSGKTGYVITTTAAAPKYHCIYQLTVTFTDGTSYSKSDTVDPEVGMIDGRTLTLEMSKDISNVTVTMWQCSPRRTPDE